MNTTLRQVLALAGSSLMAISSASAQTTVNWDGDTSATWATAGNWDTAPTNSLTANIANFNLATYGGNPVWAPTVGTATSIAGITIGSGNGTMTLTNSAALSIGASGISIANGAGAFTISGSTTLGAGQSWINNSANLFTFGAVTNGANLLTIGGAGNTTASGVIGNGAGGLTKEGTGLLTLNAANTYTGATILNAGTLQLGNASSMGTSTLTMTSGTTLQLRNDGNTTFTAPLATAPTTGVTYNIDVNQATVAGANKKLSLGNITFATSSSGSITNTINVTGGNGYILGLGTITAPSGGGSFHPVVINATTAAVEIAKFSAGSYGHVLQLQGGNSITLGNFEMGSNGNNSLTVSGSGTVVTLGTTTQTNNRAGGTAAYTLNSGTLNLTTTTSLANVRAVSGTLARPTLAINGGTLNNTSGSALTLAASPASDTVSGSPAITIGGSFAFGTVSSTSANNLNLGNGAITNAGNRTITLNGTGTTLTMGGAMTNSSGANQTTTVNGAGNTLVLGGYVLGNGRTNVIDGTANVNITGAISTTGGLTYGGSAKLTLTGASTYTGFTTVNSGVLAIVNGGSLYSNLNNNKTNAITVNSGVTIEFDNWGWNGSFGQMWYASGNIVVNGGTLRYVGATGTASGRSFTIGASGATLESATAGQTWGIAITDTPSLASNNGLLTLTGVGNGSIAQIIPGSGGLTKSGNGTWTLGGANTYTGKTIVSAGILSLTNANALQNSYIDATNSIAGDATNGLRTNQTALNLGGLSGNKDLASIFTTTTGGYDAVTGITLNVATGNSLNYSGAIDGARALTKSGAGIQVLSGTSSYTGVTTISAGVLRLDSASALPGGIGATGGTSALTFNTGGILGLGDGNFTRTLAAAGTVTAANFTGDGGWAAYGADRFVNLNNDSHSIVWGTANTGLNARTLYLGAADATHTLDFQNPLDLGTGTRTVQVADGTAAVDAKLSGILSGGTNGSLTKTGAGTLQLTAANSYTGTTTVSAGTLMLSGASGVIASTSRVAINAGATLQISNTSGSDNLGDRLNNAATVAMTSGILNFSHTGDGGTNYSETTGPVTISGTGNRIISSQAATGRTSTLTLGVLSGTLTGLQFEGPGLGDANLRNRILITGRSAGAITGATHYDPLTLLTRAAVYSIAYGVGPLTSDANVDVLGGVIPTGSDAVSIIQAGSSGDITLSSDPTIIASLVQTANQLGTVAMPGQTLRTDAVLLGSPNASLTIGTSPGSGTLTPKTSGGSLTLSNNYPGQLLTINAVIADNGTGSSLAKNGAGTVLLTAGATYTGATDVSGGTLALTGAGSLPDTSAVNLSGGTAVLHLSGISASSETIGSLTGVSGSSVMVGAKTLALNGVSPAPFAGVISGSGGGLTLLSGATQELTGDNTFTGNVTIGANANLSVDEIQTSGAQPLGQGTTPIVMQGNIGTGSTLTYTGAGAGATNRGLSLTGGQGGTVNVTAGTLTVNGPLSGSANFHKQGAGTLIMSGGSTWSADGFVNAGTLVLGGDSSPGSNSLSAGNWTVATGATMRLNTTGALETSTLTRNGTFNLEAGTLRSNTIAGSGAFVWGAGTIAPLSNLTEGSTDRTDPGGSPSGPVVREGTILDFNGNLATSNGSTLDLGGLFTDNGLRYNQISVSGSLALTATDALNISINPYLLRPNTYSSIFTGDWGTLRLVMADSITGSFDAVTGIGTDAIGFAADPDSGNTDTFINPASLAMNTYYIEYRTSGVLSGAAVLFHYKVAGSVPEPGSAGLLIAGASLIRMLRRRSDNEGSDFFQRRRKMIRRRRSRSRR